MDSKPSNRPRFCITRGPALRFRTRIPVQPPQPQGSVLMKRMARTMQARREQERGGHGAPNAKKDGAPASSSTKAHVPDPASSSDAKADSLVRLGGVLGVLGYLVRQNQNEAALRLIDSLASSPLAEAELPCSRKEFKYKFSKHMHHRQKDAREDVMSGHMGDSECSCGESEYDDSSDETAPSSMSPQSAEGPSEPVMSPRAFDPARSVAFGFRGIKSLKKDAGFDSVCPAAGRGAETQAASSNSETRSAPSDCPPVLLALRSAQALCQGPGPEPAVEERLRNRSTCAMSPEPCPDHHVRKSPGSTKSHGRSRLRSTRGSCATTADSHRATVDDGTGTDGELFLPDLLPGVLLEPGNDPNDSFEDDGFGPTAFGERWPTPEDCGVARRW